MSLLIIPGVPALLVAVALAALYLSKLYPSKTKSPTGNSGMAAASRPERYRPMLRLLSEDDLAPVRQNKKLLARLRADRTAIFRGYVRCLALDHARLLAGLRLAALHSPVDRPDLARGILRHRLLFAALLCRLDLLLLLHCLGVRRIAVSGLVKVLDSLRADTIIPIDSTMALAA